jgi:hypothetical protein
MAAVEEAGYLIAVRKKRERSWSPKIPFLGTHLAT